MRKYQACSLIALLCCIVRLGVCYDMYSPGHGIHITQTSRVPGINRSAEAELVEYLLGGYQSTARPITNGSDVINVSLALALSRLLNVDEREQVISTYGWLDVEWTDQFLSWNPDEFYDIKDLGLLPHLVWLPDIGLVNGVKTVFDSHYFKYFRVSVGYDGRVIWRPGGHFITSCKMNIQFYPYDMQRCDIGFSGLTYSHDKVSVMNKTHMIDTSGYHEDGQWDLWMTSAMTQSLNSYDTVYFSIYLKRKPLFYVMNVIVPCLVMAGLDVFLFLLPPDSGEKVSLGVTVVLTYSVFLLLVEEQVPETSDTVPILVLFLISGLCTTSLSMIAGIFVLSFHHKNPSRGPPYCLKKLAYLLTRQRLTQKMNRKEEDDETKLFYLKNSSTQQRRALKPQNNEKITDNINYKESIKLSEIASQIERTSLYLKAIYKKLQGSEEEERNRKDWELVACMFDRIFLVFFLFALTCITLALICFYPMLESDEMKELLLNEAPAE